MTEPTTLPDREEFDRYGQASDDYFAHVGPILYRMLLVEELLEELVSRAMVGSVDTPRVNAFAAIVFDGATLGRKVQAFKKVAAEFGLSPEIQEVLRELDRLVKLRNDLAHRQPRFDFTAATVSLRMNKTKEIIPLEKLDVEVDRARDLILELVKLVPKLPPPRHTVA